MSGPSKKFGLGIFVDSSSVTSSPGSEVGPKPSDLRTGRKIDKSGPVVVRVSPTRSQVKGKAKRMIETSGRNFIASSASVVLSASLGNKLRRLLGSRGSMEFQQTWIKRTTPAGLSYWEHTARTLLTSGKGSFGWATPNTMDHIKSGNLKNRKKKGGCVNLKDQVLGGWPTPMAGSPATETHNAAGNTDSSRKTQTLVGKVLPRATPTANDFRDGAADLRGFEMRKNGKKRNDTLSRQTFGATTNSSDVETEKPAALNPEHSRWLMGFPAAWGCSGATAMQLFRKSPRSSSKRILKSKKNGNSQK